MNSRWPVAINLGLIAPLILVSLPVIARSARDQKQGGTNNSQVLKDAIKGLASNDESERKAARVALLGLGQAAIPPLIDLLRLVTPNVKVCPPGSNLPCQTEFTIISNSETRMRSEVISLLGDLHAVAAVPLLIKIMGLWRSEGAGLRYWGPERDALIEIGSSAVPELLSSLRLAEERRQSTRLVNGSLAPYLEIEERIIDVLGRIGDEQALALFEELKASNPNPIFQADLKEAEERIKQKAQQK
jgi:HEAT repeat protein